MNNFIKQQQELAKNVAETSKVSLMEITSEKDYGFAMTYNQLDTLITQTITNTGAEIMRRVEGERMSKDAPDDVNVGKWVSRKYGWNKALDTITQHIKDVIE